jgi:ketosteroid isomerase-like protein
MIDFRVIEIAAPVTNTGGSMEKSEMEIFETEKAFAKLAREKGLKAAFLAYASDEAVINRAGRLYKGKQEIEAYFDSQTSKNVQLEWTPTFVRAATSGDLGYTYGPYTSSGVDMNGETQKAQGFFHTVWKRESDGKWYYVWD